MTEHPRIRVRRNIIATEKLVKEFGGIDAKVIRVDDCGEDDEPNPCNQIKIGLKMYTLAIVGAA